MFDNAQDVTLQRCYVFLGYTPGLQSPDYTGFSLSPFFPSAGFKD